MKKETTVVNLLLSNSVFLVIRFIVTEDKHFRWQCVITGTAASLWNAKILVEDLQFIFGILDLFARATHWEKQLQRIAGTAQSVFYFQYTKGCGSCYCPTGAPRQCQLQACPMGRVLWRCPSLVELLVFLYRSRGNGALLSAGRNALQPSALKIWMDK